ncbi:TrmH family RNA methyltransferase [Phyllobacterium leguminum]|uniref:tRNA G18 (Ribose-2'-O)-methylase SpoU n=1 Tax=Phyllobacterium leguminum TaxID=314237 RepID=A0A318T0A1_9HYPH|nr:RNA methyltransferase [Phyllobacterium leguminum]PYE87079.1 tRNA G18 (ribose-2'-O)-methylase SpoU [Phyllobacterium leguminum]
MTSDIAKNARPKARVVKIEHADDPRLAPYRDIRERDLVGRTQRFVAEGKVVLNVLLSSARFEAESILVLDNRLSGLEAQLRLCPEELPVYRVSQATMDEISGFHVHRGILAIGRRKAIPSSAELLAGLPERALVAVLCGISNHDNVGSIFRNAAAFEADCVLMDETCCDPLYRKAIRVSVGATLKVPYARHGSIEDVLASLSQEGFNLLALSPSGTQSIYEASPAPRLALLFGTEGEGLPKPLLDRLNTARIPMSRDFDSLNVATASGIALSRFSRFS